MADLRKKFSQDTLFKIGEIAQQTGLAVATIRYYESLGLIEPKHRSESNYRYYNTDAIERLQFIKKAQSLQFSLSEIQQILNVRQQGDPVCLMVRDLLDGKIAQLETQIAQMLSLKTELEQYRNRWANKPLDDPRSQELCSLIAEVAALSSEK